MVGPEGLTKKTSLVASRMFPYGFITSKMLCVGAVMSFLTLVSCAMQNINEQNFEQVEERFQMGETVLSTSSTSIGNYVASRSEMQTLYAVDDWPGLAKTVIQINYGNDLDYFYLGRSADGLKLYNAAAKYYQRALRASLRCSGFFTGDDCDGFRFPSDILAHFEHVRSNQ